MVEAENEPPFLISLIDHKSLVDYDVAMQLLRYMMCIWTAYKKELEAKHEGITRRKEFRYPVIIPIVYFEGEAKWTAARNFRERISRESQFRAVSSASCGQTEPDCEGQSGTCDRHHCICNGEPVF